MEKLIAGRIDKLSELRKLGIKPYPNDFKPSISIEELRRNYGDLSAEELEGLGEVFRVAGRVVLQRSFGKAIFFNIQDYGGRIQCYIRQDVIGKDKLKFFRRFIDLGDIVGVSGTLFRTKTGELTILVDDFKLLSKGLRPLPEKWHGLTDVELRYRYRYLDLISNKEVVERFRKRTEIIKKIRSFFDERGFLEVETPMMHPIPGGAAAKPFKTHHNALDMDLYLRIAPELYLKRLLVGGFDKIYELSRNFRNEGISTQHNPEFTMIEFYQAYATYDEFIRLTEELFSELVLTFCGGYEFTYQGKKLNFKPPFRRINLRESVLEFTPLTDKDLDDRDALENYAKSIGIEVYDGMTEGEIITEIFEEVVEEKLIDPTFVLSYPKEVSPLARSNDDDPSIVDRFELFIYGREIANGFSELNDPIEQRRRFEEQIKAARRRGEEREMDEDFLIALEYGMPPAAGEGIGIDRLVMILTDAPSIRDVILFPLLRPQR